MSPDAVHSSKDRYLVPQVPGTWVAGLGERLGMSLGPSQLLGPRPENRAAEEELEEGKDSERNRHRVPDPAVGNCDRYHPSEDGNGDEAQQNPREEPRFRGCMRHAGVIAVVWASVRECPLNPRRLKSMESSQAK
jgi:hypothetical protein